MKSFVKSGRPVPPGSPSKKDIQPDLKISHGSNGNIKKIMRDIYCYGKVKKMKKNV